jgi:para-nitrobenzyl esterase
MNRARLKCLYLIAAPLLVAHSAYAQGSPSTVVQTDSGTVRGVAKAGVISWKGIPFAAPPVGILRWRVPQSTIPWTGVRDASQFGPACMQADDLPKSEDCLTLNVWKPEPAAQPLPVMVWIYGGAMVHGNTAQYPGDALAAQGVIVVSMNYRMGRLGFFAHPALAAEAPNDVRGNYGYMDQLAALKWVQRNIAAFGGDPKQVTIFGESAGGGSVMSHLESPMSRGLFARAILQSPGTPGARVKEIPTSDLAAAEQMAVSWARAVGVSGEGTAALEQLRALPAEKLLEGASVKETLAALAAHTTPLGMAMSILDGRFLTERPEQALAAGHMAPVPTMVGANDRDLGLGTATDKDELFAIFGAKAALARKLYDPQGNQTLDELKQQIFADRTMIEPARHFANEMTRAGNAVWVYRFAYVSEAQRGQLMGTIHGFEIPFTFDLPSAIVKEKVTPNDELMAAIASGYWTEFGKTGDPNGGGKPEWPRYDPSVDRILHFTNSGVIVGTDPLKSRLDLVEAGYIENK